MAQWYYARNQQQQGPVSWDNLRELASSGRLARHDMVWCDGMADWKRADAVEGLVGAGGGTAVTAEPNRAKRAVDALADDRKDRDERTDRPERDEREEARQRRKKRRKKEGMSPGALAGIIGGGVIAGLMIIVIIIVLLVRTGSRQANLPPPPPLPGVAAPPVAAGAPAGGAAAAAVQPNSYVVTLREDQQNTRAFTFQQGQNVNITVTTHGGGVFNAPDVDLYVTRAGDPAFTIFDDSLSKDCFVSFVAPATDQYFLRLDNLGPGRATSNVNLR